MFGWFKNKSSSVEKWANHNAKKATPDDLIAGAIVASFAKDFKHWKFEGNFHQHWTAKSGFQQTTLSRKMVGKKNVDITFIFIETKISDGRQNSPNCSYRYKVVGCEVNGVRISDDAFSAIYTNWNNVVVKVRAAEQVAAEAKAKMEANEIKWNLAEGLLGMKRNGLGVLVPIKTVTAEDAQ